MLYLSEDPKRNSLRREPLAITVAATTPEDARLWISPGVGSNYGRCVDVWAPGSAILSASHRSDRATEFRSGTSQAVPFVAGTAALYLQNSSGAQAELHFHWCGRPDRGPMQPLCSS